MSEPKPQFISCETDSITPHEFRKQPVLERYLPAVDERTGQFLRENSGLYSQMVDYHMGIRSETGVLLERREGGKALRPTLCSLTADILMGDRWTRVIPAAVALEVLHNFTLIHDDIQDGDDTRRGKPTVWKIHGVAQGINAGDAAHSLSDLALSDLRQQGFPAEAVLDAKDLLVRTGLQVIEGQILDVSFEQRLDVSTSDYLAMISRKTGVLIQNSIMMGALLGGADPATAHYLQTYGYHLGRVFQISDDRLGIWGDPQKTGKPVGSDIIHRKKSLPVVMALSTDNSTTRTEMLRIYQQDKPLLEQGDIDVVMDILETTGTREQIDAEIDHTHHMATEAIQAAAVGWAEQDYLALADALAYRQK